MDFTMCNSTDINWYVRMPRDLPPVIPKEEMQPKLCKEVGVILEPTFTV